MTRVDCALVDYGAGNLASVRKGLAAAGAAVRMASTPADLAAADLVVVPGVGHFSATAALDARWREGIRSALEHGAVLFGICLGMQWLYDGSDEAGDVAGLGLLPGRCEPIRGPVKVPHVGWNTLEPTGAGSRLLAGIAPGAFAYFTHGFAAPVTDAAVATTTHGVRFAAAVERGRVMGVQFHPEKSGEAGLRLLRNVVDLAVAAAEGAA